MITLLEIFRWIGYTIADAYRRLALWLLRRDQLVAGTERKFRALLESAPDAMIIVNWHGHITLVNGQAERMFGRAREDMVGQNMTDLLDRDYRDQQRQLHKTFALEGSESTRREHLEMVGLAGDSRAFPIEMSVSPMPTDRGPLLFVSVRDITERKEAEAALRAAEERFRAAFEDAPVGIALANLDGTLVQVNRALCEITGRTRDALESTTFAALVSPPEMASNAISVARVIAGQEPSLRVERTLIDAKGRPVPVDLSVGVARNTAGDPSHVLYQVNDITERKRFQERLQHLADHDELTGMFNRRRFEQELGIELARAARTGDAGAVLAIDIDHFKHVNDTLGHSVGDDLITRVSRMFRERLRMTDTIARLGGDEFAVILPLVSEEDAVRVAESLLAALHEECRLEMAGGPPRRVTASIGIAPFDASTDTGEHVLVAADVALYDAKEAGRDCVRVYGTDQERQATMQAGLTWADRIRDALDEDRFVLYAQPIAALGSEPETRSELLVRMLGEDGELIPPGAFLPIAERSDLILAIDRWVLGEAIELLAAERRAGREGTFSINLSAKSVTDPELPAHLEAALRSAGIGGAGLCIEVTETAAIVNVERARAFAETARSLGCEFALDDFGSGFASFYYLKHMDFDYLKIDGEFIRDLPTSETNQLVVRSLVDIARGLGQRTIAEFVEDDATLELLRDYGVDYAQGYHVGRPAPIERAAVDDAPARLAA